MQANGRIQKTGVDKHPIEDALVGWIADADKLMEGDTVSPSKIRKTV